MTSELLGQTLGSRYRFDKLLGEGTFARVFRIYDLHRHATLAAKVLRRDIASEPALLERFRREADVLARLQHPHIVRYYDIVDADDHVFILMDYVPGQTLQDVLTGLQAPLAPRDSLAYLNPLATALHFAHSEGIIHRDLKPANILLHENGTLYITDFGIARILGEASSLTLGGTTMGTPLYISPEQVTGGLITVATDIYALGIILYQMYTGQAPFRGESAGITGSTTAERILHEHIHTLPEPPTSLNPHISPAVEDLLLRSLQKDPAARFHSVIQLYDTLAEAIGVPPLSLEPLPGPPDMKLPEWSQFMGPVPGLPVAITPPSQPAAEKQTDGLDSSQPETQPHLEDALKKPVPFSPSSSPPTMPSLDRVAYEDQHALPPPGIPPASPSYMSPPAYDYMPGEHRSRMTFPVALLAVGALIAAVAVCAGGLYLFGPNNGKSSNTRAADQTVTLTDALTVTSSPSNTWTPEPTDTLPARGGTRIAFDSARNGDMDIFTMNADGSDLQQLTGEPGPERGPSWSPDGSQIAFYGAPSRQSDYDIYIINRDGSGLRNLTDSPDEDDRYPTWSPDGSQIAFHSDADGDYDITIINVDGAGRQLITRGGNQELGPDWSPDGTRIVFHTDMWGYPYEIGVVDLSTSQVRQLTDTDDINSFPTWSPDGSRIAYHAITVTDQAVNLYIMTADGVPLRQLTNTPDRDAFPDWSADGLYIIYQHGLEGASDISMIPAAGGDSQALTGPQRNFLPEWEPVY
ncbi:MAG: serine/threonine-protein kinase [Anaerolineae bacterium]|nr:serine/threonine-protein kinase [Anaerolineae bacterium]